MRGHGCKLKRLLRPAVEAYLDEPTWALAARRAGIARSTLCIWMKLPEFRRMADQLLQERFRQGCKPAGAKESSPDQKNWRRVDGGGDDRQSGRPAA
jgi:hypothetical protein